MSWITTGGCQAFDLADPKPERIHIEDIAAALARICRFGGHSSDPDRFYSVAQHSLLVLHLVNAPGQPRADLNTQRWALLHDAAEAYIGDITSPVKALLGPAYRLVEAPLVAAIAQRFRLEPMMPQAVRAADRIALCSEASALFRNPPDFACNYAVGRFLRDKVMTVAEAREAFLGAAGALGLRDIPV